MDISNFVKTGLVSKLNPENATVRVYFEDTKLISDDLQIVGRKSKNDKDYWMPDIGEQVLCLFFPNGVNCGFVLGAVFSKGDLTPTNNADKKIIKFSDGGLIEYDRSIGTMNIKAPNKINITCPQITVKGAIKASEDIIAAGISGKHHRHSGVEKGPFFTDEPF